MKCGNCGSGEFEHLPVGAILYRNRGRRSAMLAAASKALQGAIRRGEPPATFDAVIREAMRPFDRFAEQIKAVH